MKDHILRITGGDHQIRLFVAVTNDMVEKARATHKTSPVATAALGRTITAGAIMGSMMKGGQKDVLTLQFKGDGPIRNVLVTANAKAEVKGYVGEPLVDIPLKPNGKLDVSGAIGRGHLNIIKDIGMKEPYNGQIELVSGEIAEDLTYYFASSEQTPSVVALGVLVDKDYSVKQSGGFILQLLPNATEEVIQQLESNIGKITSMTAMLEEGLTSEEIASTVLDGLDYQVLDRVEPVYECDCSRGRVTKALMTVGSKELEQMIDDGETIDMSCHFCNTHYKFQIHDLQEILHSIKKM